MADVIAYAKANPGKLNYGSSGAGSPHHLAGELLRQKTGIDIVHVPIAVAARRSTICSAATSGGVPEPLHRRAASQQRQDQILAVVEKTRYAAMPDVPTIGETVPGFEMSSWHGLFAPAATPAP